MNKVTLVVMAAGMGSRFGGCKQISPVGPNGEILLDFSVYDAIAAGFTKVVFIIREENEADFRAVIGDRLSKKIEVEYVYQDTSILPEGRKKPFGTGHAVLCCMGKVNEPFAVINADDYYGKSAFKQIYNHLKDAKGTDFAMVAFDLKNTLTDNGTVSRGICELDGDMLKSVTEITKIKDMKYTDDGENWTKLPEDTLASMNFWGFTTELFPALKADFDNFLNTADLQKDEFYLPFAADKMLKEGTATVKVLQSHDKWYGMTYREDSDSVKAALAKKIEDGEYNGI
ncbi:MAG: NTP transferase domain-containing protein [Clostridia bacterium]|nr:NTP transferase domain-containing protein [Clostridia bacterium]MBQ9958184.1 NTP transferase domain-containing protein [Clostridia bacterium]